MKMKGRDRVKLHPASHRKTALQRFFAVVNGLLTLPGIGCLFGSTDYMKLYADQIRQWGHGREFKVLGTDGFGRSDSRKRSRHGRLDGCFII
jgi:pyruvate dehydrogenase complex dehydrogenase (E1) component